MKARRREAFTLIELMVSLVVAGILMAALVGVSGTVQRSFGRSKDIIELQGNLRIAMHGLVEDISRAAYMYSPDPAQGVDQRTVGIPPAQADQAVEYDINTNMFTLRGNYVSSRDYKWNLDFPNDILCRNDLAYDARCCDLFGTGSECYDFPFGDGPEFGDVFCQNELVRLDAGNGEFSYHTINFAANPSITLAPAPDRTRIPGSWAWVSPVTTVQYQMINDPGYTRKYLGVVLEADRWVLQRISTDCRGVQVAEVADFLLSPVGAAPGFVVAPYNIDSTDSLVGQICAPEFPFTVGEAATPIDAANPVDPTRLRSFAVILRGRTEMEDPGLRVANPDHSVDLDGNPANGMAHVRVERTMVQLRNMGITYCVQ